MKYVLILFLVNAPTTDVRMQEFNSKQSCKDARRLITKKLIKDRATTTGGQFVCEKK